MKVIKIFYILLIFRYLPLEIQWAFYTSSAFQFVVSHISSAQ